MAKAVRTAQGQPGRRPARPQPGLATAGADRRQGLLEYFRGVAEELRKVVWPGRDELLRMTGIVIATVLIFGALIGGADYVLSIGVRQVYTSNPTSTTNTTTRPTTTIPQPVVTSRPTLRPSAVATPHATPVH